MTLNVRNGIYIYIKEAVCKVSGLYTYWDKIFFLCLKKYIQTSDIDKDRHEWFIEWLRN